MSKKNCNPNAATSGKLTNSDRESIFLDNNNIPHLFSFFLLLLVYVILLSHLIRIVLAAADFVCICAVLQNFVEFLL